MKFIPNLMAKELRGYFYSPVAYVVIAGSLFINGWTFWIMANALNTPTAQVTGSIMQVFFGGTFFFWFQMILFAPVITMRLFSEEAKTGTLEVLMTSPVTDFEVVVGKFLAAWTFYIVMWIPTFLYIVILKKHAAIDMGPVFTGYMGTFLVGGFFLSIGLLMSSLTKNQITAAVMGFVVSSGIFSVAFLAFFMNGAIARDVIAYVSLLEHFEDFGKGLIDTRAIIFYGTMITLNLFLTIRVVEARKWK